jgi:methylated-DNA-[protein]-cysteine S-methyltransferase
MRNEGKPTSFEADVYRITASIPPGRVAGYGWIVRELGYGSARAVGRALGRNPFAPSVPCHRVIRGDGSIGGFMAGNQPARIGEKLTLLQREGVEFGPNGKLLDPGRMIQSQPA